MTMKSVSSRLTKLASLLPLLLSSQSINAEPLRQPTVVSSSSSNWSFDLSVDTFRFQSTQASFNTRAYCFNDNNNKYACDIPGPTFVVKPGDTFTLRLHNKLTADAAAVNEMNTMHNPNTTNIHMHGLHIDSNVDSPFLKTLGGQTSTYVYKIKQDHAPGLHWYHDHTHGASTFHLLGGMLGAIIVAPVSGSVVESLQSKIPSTLLVFNHFAFGHETQSGVLTQGCYNGYQNLPYNPFRTYSYNELSDEIKDNLSTELVSSNTNNFIYMTNGQYQPTLTIKKTETWRWQMVNAAGQNTLEIRNLPSQCKFEAIALDGVYTTTKDAGYIKTALPRNKILIVTGSRYEVQVQCNTPGTYSITGDFGENDQRKSQVLFTLVVQDIAAPLSADKTYLWTNSDLINIAATRPAYLSNLQNAVVNAKTQVDVHQMDRTTCKYQLAFGSDCGAAVGNVGSGSATCPFKSYTGNRGGTGYGVSIPNENYPLIAKLGDVVEFTMYAALFPFHTVHLHTHHFQLISFSAGVELSNNEQEEYIQIGEWRDTIPALDGKTVFRFRAADFAGEIPFHCHFTRHGDLGMMETMYVCDEASGACDGKGPVTLPPVQVTDAPTTASPSTASPTTVKATTPAPSTAAPTTSETITTSNPTTTQLPEPTTAQPTQVATSQPTISNPSETCPPSHPSELTSDCILSLWHSTGCTTTIFPKTDLQSSYWKSMSSIEDVIYDMNLWSTTNDAVHKQACYKSKVCKAKTSL